MNISSAIRKFFSLGPVSRRDLNFIYTSNDRLSHEAVDRMLWDEGSDYVMKHFRYPAETIDFVKACIKDESRIDLFITDFDLRITSGYELAATIKRMAQEHNIIIPTLVFTVSMQDESETIQKGLTKGIFDSHVSFTSDPIEIRRVMLTLPNNFHLKG